MSLPFGILFSANTGAAKQGVQSLQRDFKLAKGDIHAAGAALKTFNGDLGAMAAKVNLSGLRVGAAGVGFDQLGNSAAGMGAEMDIAAGQVGNVFAQLNDIGVMMAAGQNPLQLAIQQGSQLNQVFGPLGVRGSLVALRRAFASMISPMSLLTIGAIAGGSALVQWGMSALQAEEGTDALAEAIEELKTQTADAQAGYTVFLRGLRDTTELPIDNEIRALAERIRELQDVSDGPRRGQSLNNQRALELEREKAALEDLIAERRRLMDLEDERDARNDYVREMAGLFREAQARMADARIEAENLLGSLQDQVTINGLIARLGEDNVAVTEARVQAERDAFVQTVETRDISEDLKNQLIDAWDAANGIASVDMAGNVTLAANEAARLAENLAAAQGASIARNVERLGGDPNDFFDPRGSEFGSDGAGRLDPPPALTNRPRVSTRPRRGSRRSAGRGGGGVSQAVRARERELEAIERLIAREEQALEILRTSDPVQKEMIRNRETLAAATDAQRQKIEALIRQRHEETAAAEHHQQVMADLGQISSSVLDGLIVQGRSASDVLKQLAVDLLEVILRGSQLGGGGGGLGGTLLGGFFDLLTGGSSGTSPAPVTSSTTARAARPVPTQVVYRQTVNQSFNDVRGDSMVRQIARRETEGALDLFRAQVLPGDVNTILDDPRRVG